MVIQGKSILKVVGSKKTYKYKYIGSQYGVKRLFGKYTNITKDGPPNRMGTAKGVHKGVNNQ